ncbi:GNAT family N-acetyltransferase [Halobacillus sp. Marseille-Q1614]|uniref:GNAT family N-acetyltransferase n=1 Tax=Halobacillus sp. Marseille-Q1614 TaxID=2709134 RepID=UPI001C2D8125|nr:GNAT family N-acetyltransferase [Halobacillus sp. Marseille-Q1614]
MNSIQRDNGTFFVEENSERVAELAYKQGGSTMTITHTHVKESEQGEGLATELVENAVEYAREQNMKINPMCSFAKKVIEERTEFQDVLAK